ncbi:MAG: hypothetical protein U0531_03890 [Dehalococcoidia bacterium]
MTLPAGEVGLPRAGVGMPGVSAGLSFLLVGGVIAALIAAGAAVIRVITGRPPDVEPDGLTGF